MKRRNFLTTAVAASAAAIVGLPKATAAPVPSATLEFSDFAGRCHPMAILEDIIKANNKQLLAGAIHVRQELFIHESTIRRDYYTGDLQPINGNAGLQIIAEQCELPQWLIDREMDENTEFVLGHGYVPVLAEGMPDVYWIKGDYYLAVMFDRPYGDKTVVTLSRNEDVLKNGLGHHVTLGLEEPLRQGVRRHIHITGDVVALAVADALKSDQVKRDFAPSVFS